VKPAAAVFLYMEMSKGLHKGLYMSEIENFQVDLNRTLIQDGPKFLSHALVVKGDFAYL
jgi:hypothetical protein